MANNVSLLQEPNLDQVAIVTLWLAEPVRDHQAALRNDLNLNPGQDLEWEAQLTSQEGGGLYKTYTACRPHIGLETDV